MDTSVRVAKYQNRLLDAGKCTRCRQETEFNLKTQRHKYRCPACMRRKRLGELERTG
jgi:Zn finger protein HypA/HybF involved in hydrogenase expression